jgi:hypothetical protein
MDPAKTIDDFSCIQLWQFPTFIENVFWWIARYQAIERKYAQIMDGNITEPFGISIKIGTLFIMALGLLCYLLVKHSTIPSSFKPPTLMIKWI